MNVRLKNNSPTLDGSRSTEDFYRNYTFCIYFFLCGVTVLEIHYILVMLALYFIVMVSLFHCLFLQLSRIIHTRFLIRTLTIPSFAGGFSASKHFDSSAQWNSRQFVLLAFSLFWIV